MDIYRIPLRTVAIISLLLAITWIGLTIGARHWVYATQVQMGLLGLLVITLCLLFYTLVKNVYDLRQQLARAAVTGQTKTIATPPAPAKTAPTKTKFTNQAKRKVADMAEQLQHASEESRELLAEHIEPYRGRSGADKIAVDFRHHGVRFFGMSDMASRLLPNKQEGRFMEIGANNGLLSIIFKLEHPQWECWANDLAPQIIGACDELARIYGADVQFDALNATDVGEFYDGKTFDLIYICELLEHIDTPGVHAAILQGAIDRCAADGRVIISVPYEDRIPAPGHVTVFYKDNLEKLLAPYAQELTWHEDLREEYAMEKHWLVSFQPKKSQAKPLAQAL